MLTQANANQSMVLARQTSNVAAAPGRTAWLYAEGPAEYAIEDDDFEGNRNWAVIIVFATLALSPIFGIALLAF